MRLDRSPLSPATVWLAVLTVATLTLLLLTSLAPAALAHTELVSSSPAAGAVVTDPPTTLTLTFSEAPKAGEDFDVEVVDGNGDDLVSAPPTLEGTALTAPLNLAVIPGRHMVRYIVVAEDGDPIIGEMSFDFQPPQEIATPPTVEPTATPIATATPVEATSPPPPTPDPVATATPTPSATAAATPTPLATETTSDGGLSPPVGVLLGVLTLAAVGAVAVVRFRNADQDR